VGIWLVAMWSALYQLSRLHISIISSRLVDVQESQTRSSRKPRKGLGLVDIESFRNAALTRELAEPLDQHSELSKLSCQTIDCQEFAELLSSDTRR
jgi:hypothetical protein